MNRLRVLTLLAAVAVLFLFVFAVGYLLRGLTAPRAPVSYNTATVLRQVQTLSQLVTVKYVMEKVVIRAMPAENPIGRAVGSEDRVLLLAHGIVKAGVDLGTLDAKHITVSGRKVSIRLPPAQITDSYLDEDQTKVIDRSTGLFTSFDKNLEQGARQDAVDAIRRAARASGILRDADDRARLQLTALFHQIGLEEVEFIAP